MHVSSIYVIFCGCSSSVIEQNVVACAAVLCVGLHELLYIVLLVDIGKISEDSLNLLLCI